MKYLITGGCGFLGSNIAHSILREGKELVILDNMSKKGSLENLNWLKSTGNFEFHSVDIRNNRICKNIIANYKPEIIFHLAGQVAMTTSISNPRLDFETNVLGTFNILEAIRLASPDTAIIYSSSNKVYGDLEHLKYTESDTRFNLPDFPHGIPESIKLDFKTPYGCSKGSADQYVLDYSHVYGIKGVVFRHSSMYGGRQFYTFDQGWIGWFCDRAIKQANGDINEFTITGNGKQVRDLLYSDDIVSLYLLASKHVHDIAGEAFNVGGGIENSLSIIELIRKLEDRINKKLAWRFIEKRISDQRFFVADIRKIIKYTKWMPSVQANEGIERMFDWVGSINDC